MNTELEYMKIELEYKKTELEYIKNNVLGISLLIQVEQKNVLKIPEHIFK